MKHALVLVLLGAIPLTLPPTARAQEDDDASAAPGTQRYAPARFKDTNRIQLRYEWNRKSTLNAYETNAHRNPKWDADAKECLTAFARIRSLPSRIPPDVYQRCSTSAQRAMKAGCTDPLINYLHLRYGEPAAPDAAASTRLMQQAAEELDASSYPPLRKYYAHHFAGEYTPPPGTNNLRIPDKIVHHRQAAYTNLVRLTRDATTPSEEIYAAADTMLTQIERTASFHAAVWRSIEKNLFKNWPDDYLIHLLKGRYHITYAWQGRGNALGANVPAENMKLYMERTQIAEEALRRAWELNPQDERIPLYMLNLCSDRNLDRSEMELWFGRAMTLKPDYFTACRRKAHYLEPRWHGSLPELLTFGRHCATNVQWTGPVPLLLVTIHSNLYNYTPRDQKPAYWGKPEVWPDLQFSFDHYLKLNPGDHHQRGGYIRHAALCGQWDTVRRQLPLLTRTNYSSFGGQAVFRRILQDAADKTGRPVP